MGVKVNVIFYSMYGHVYRMAEAVAAGVKEVSGAEVALHQVAEIMPDAVLEKSGAKAARAAFAHVPVATMDTLTEPHTVIFGTPTRFGNMCAQMRELSGSDRRIVGEGVIDWKDWKRLCINGDAARRPGNHHYEFSLDSVAPRDDPCRCAIQRIGSDAHERHQRRHALWRDHTCGADGSRQPSQNELKIARYQGRHVAEIAGKLFR